MIAGADGVIGSDPHAVNQAERLDVARGTAPASRVTPARTSAADRPLATDQPAPLRTALTEHVELAPTDTAVTTISWEGPATGPAVPTFPPMPGSPTAPIAVIGSCGPTVTSGSANGGGQFGSQPLAILSTDVPALEAGTATASTLAAVAPVVAADDDPGSRPD